jgi:Domain of unknown function (DUF4157)
MSNKAPIKQNVSQTTVPRRPQPSVARHIKPGNSPVIGIQQLNAVIGNQKVQRMLQTGAIQAKLKVGQPDDKYEKEADQMADKVMRMPEPDCIDCKKEENDVQAKKEDDDIQRQPEDEEIQAKKEDEEEPVQAKEEDEEAAQRKPSSSAPASSSLNSVPSGGQPLQASTRSFFEPRFGRDFSNVRVHDGPKASESAQSIKAKAYTKGSDIVFGSGYYSPGTHSGKQLLAHELTHVVQQGKAGTASTMPQLQRKPAAKKEGPVDQPLPGDLELKGKAKTDNSDFIGKELNERKLKKAQVMVHYGKLARGLIEVRRYGKRYSIYRQFIPLSHPLFARLKEAAPELQPGLIISADGKKKHIKGYIGLKATSAKKPPGQSALKKKIKTLPSLIGLNGMQLTSTPKLTNKLEGGLINLGAKGIPLKLGGVFSGEISLEANETAVTKFEGKASLSIQGLTDAEMEIKRNEKGLVTGKAKIAVQMPKNVSGSVEVAWDGVEVQGVGKLGYQGEKLSGNVTVQVMERSKAEALEQQKKAPPEGTPAPAAKKKKSKKKKKTDYAVFGEGDLTFAFTDWLNGTAHVIIDSKGFVTVIGKITPQKEFELFPQKDFNKHLFKHEARARYGIPVVGNIFIFANIGMDAFAKLGPGKLYNIQVDGTYSTDPAKAQSFSIRGSLNVSAAAGLKLRAEAGAGLEIMSHDIKAGAGINATAGVKGYAEATPIIGYREKVGPTGEDKKAEFFIRGEMEIAAQPFLGLGGDLFVELDSPWWSPAPDKKWTWPLFNKEYPIGGSLGFGADIDYVFGSGKWPSVKFKPVDFSAEKFMTDMYSDKAKSGSGKKSDKQGKWKEKNSKAATAPPKESKKTDAKSGKLADKPAANAKAPSGKIKGKKATPNARTAEGKTVKELQKEAAKKGKKPEGKDLKGAKGTPDPKKAGKDPLAAKDTVDSKKVKNAVKGALKGKRFTSKAQAQKVLDGIYKTHAPQGLKGIKIDPDASDLSSVKVMISASIPDIVEVGALSREELERLAFDFTSFGNARTSLYASFDNKIPWRPSGGSPFTNHSGRHAEENFLRKIEELIADIDQRRSRGELSTPPGQPVPVTLDISRFPCGAERRGLTPSSQGHDCSGQLTTAAETYKDRIKLNVRASSPWAQGGSFSKIILTHEEDIIKMMEKGIRVQPLHIWEILQKALKKKPIPAGFETMWTVQYLNTKITTYADDAYIVKNLIEAAMQSLPKEAADSLNLLWKTERELEAAVVGQSIGPTVRRRRKKK